MRFLLIDTDAEYRQVLRYHVGVEWPDAVIDDYEPTSTGVLAQAHDMGDYDCVLLGYPLTNETELEWLSALRKVGGCPPIVLFAEPSNEFLAVDALKAGAASYFPKGQVSHQRLIGVIRKELGTIAATGMHRATHQELSAASNYRFLQTLHASDVASVYLAEDNDTGEQLAVKVIRYVPDAGGENLFDRFLQEYEIIASLDNLNVVRIFDLGIADDHAFIAMEYLSAGSLAERLNGPLNPAQAIDYTKQIAGALDAVHSAGIMHRDLKPANIMFREDGTLALIDFGLAKQITLEAALTGAGQIFGTPYYMSPEQGHAEPADQRSDLYSLGCIFHEMLTGKRPFTASTAMGVIYKHANADRPTLSGGLEALQPLLDGLLAADPKMRYQSARDIVAELGAG